jgi:hypothetical protein
MACPFLEEFPPRLNLAPSSTLEIAVLAVKGKIVQTQKNFAESEERDGVA